MFNNAVHYRASDEPLGNIIDDDKNYLSCPVVSAGHQLHEYTTGCAFEKIM